MGWADALRLGLLFRTPTLMRSRGNVRALPERIEAMGRKEAGYWLVMAVHCQNSRRVLTALRSLLIDPQQAG